MFYQIVKHCFKNIYVYCKTLCLNSLKQLLLMFFDYFRSLTNTFNVMISNQDKLKVENFFKAKLPNLKCPLCGTASFTFQEADFFVSITEDGINKLGTGDKFSGLRKFAIDCNNCAHILYFSTTVMGI